MFALPPSLRVLLRPYEWPMIVTVITVTMVQLTLEEVIDMIAMRNRLVPTIVMPARATDSIAPGRILVAHFNNMLIIVSFMSSMKMSVA
jgi:hypothetical protein